MANWLNSVFFNFDKSAFILMNNLQKVAGGFFSPFCEFISFFGDGGICLIVLSLVLLLFRKSRKTGASMLFAIIVGALFTNVILKNAIARERPFNENPLYTAFWLDAGASSVSEFSFPSGHTTVVMTSMTALFLSTNKKKSWTAYIFVLLTGFARVYLIVHYLTDVLAGLLVGGASGVIGYYLCKVLFKWIEKNDQKKACAFMLNADIMNLIKKKKD